MLNYQSIHSPAGINVIGTSVVRVEPDQVVLRIGVTTTQAHPREAFAECRAVIEKVRARLNDANVPAADVRTSNLRLSQKRARPNSADAKLIGYQAALKLQITLKSTSYETLLSDLIDAGANLIDGIDFATSKLSELRTQARQRAVANARQKAELYAKAAEAKVGRPLHIEDLNPDQLRRREPYKRDVVILAEDEDPSDNRPGAINVGASVLVCFALEP